MPKLLTEIFKLCNIEEVHIVSYHPTANGLVKRKNRKVLYLFLPTYPLPQPLEVYDRHQQWDECLTLAQTAITNAYYATIGFSLYILPCFTMTKECPMI